VPGTVKFCSHPHALPDLQHSRAVRCVPLQPRPHVYSVCGGPHVRPASAQGLRVVVLAALLRMLVEAPEEVPPRVPGLLADLAGAHPPLQRRAMDGGALESLADLAQLPEPETCDELLVRAFRV